MLWDRHPNLPLWTKHITHCSMENPPLCWRLGKEQSDFPWWRRNSVFRWLLDVFFWVCSLLNLNLRVWAWCRHRCMRPFVCQPWPSEELWPTQFMRKGVKLQEGNFHNIFLCVQCKKSNSSGRVWGTFEEDKGQGKESTLDAGVCHGTCQECSRLLRHTVNKNAHVVRAQHIHGRRPWVSVLGEQRSIFPRWAWEMIGSYMFKKNWGLLTVKDEKDTHRTVPKKPYCKAHYK